MTDENIQPDAPIGDPATHAQAQAQEPARAALRKQADESATQQFAVEAARLMKDLHCEHIVIYDVRGLSDITDVIIIASGTSDRQIQSVGDELGPLGKAHGFQRFGSDVDGPTTWLVVDFVDVMVHIFEPATRAHYDLEMMWGDAPQLVWQR